MHVLVTADTLSGTWTYTRELVAGLVTTVLVAFNTGTGFASPVPWPGAPDGACADSTSVGLAGIDWNTARLCNGDTSQGAGGELPVPGRPRADSRVRSRTRPAEPHAGAAM